MTVTTEIPWGDGSGDKIYLARTARETLIPRTGQSYSGYSYTIDSRNRWVYSTTYKSDIVPVSPGATYRIDKGSNPGVMAVLQTNEHGTSVSVDFSESYPARIVGDDIPTSIVVPADAHYIYFVEETSAGIATAQLYLIDETFSEGDQTVAVSSDANTGTVSRTKNITFSGTEDEQINFADYHTYDHFISVQNKWASGYTSKMIPVNPGETYRIVKTGDNPGVIAILQSNVSTTGTTPSYSSSYPSRIVGNDFPDTIVIPSDGNYFYVSMANSSGATTVELHLVNHSAITWSLTVTQIPYDAEVAYLQSSGTQYIDTGLNPAANEEIEITFQYIGTQSTIIFGVRDSSTSKKCTIGSGSSGTIIYASLGNASNATLSSFDTNKHTVKINTGTGKASIDGGTEVNIGTFQSYSRAICIFACRQRNNVSYYATAKIYSVKIGTRAEYIPVRVGQVGYMYDKVTGTLLGNNGSGSFTLGPDV